MGTLFIEPGSPWDNATPTKPSLSVFDESLDSEIFYRLIEAKRLIEDWRKHYNQVGPHSPLNYQPPALETVLWPGPPGQLAHPAGRPMY